MTESERPAPSYAPKGDSRAADKVVNLNNGGASSRSWSPRRSSLSPPERSRSTCAIAAPYSSILEKTDPAVARRLIDFLSGVAYAQDGKIRRVASATYIITPFNVDLMGDQLDDMESGEFHL